MGIVVRSRRDLKDMSDATSNSAISLVKANMIPKSEQSEKKGIV